MAQVASFLLVHEACTQPAQLCAAGAQLTAHTLPALQTGFMAPAWRLLHMSWRVILDLGVTGCALKHNFQYL